MGRVEEEPVKDVGFIKSVFSREGSWSSKRLFGGLGMLVILGGYVYALIVPITLPECTEFLAATCASLLGVDAITNAIKKE